MSEKDAVYVWRWVRTKWGWLAPELRGRKGELCTVFARGKDGKRGVEFADGYRVVAPFYAVRKATPDDMARERGNPLAGVSR